MREHRVKFKKKVTAWCGNCYLRVKFKFLSPYKAKDPKKDKDGKEVKGDKEYEKWTEKEKKDYKLYNLKSYRLGLYECGDCLEIKLLEFPELI